MLSFWIGLMLGIMLGMLVGLIMIWSDRPKRNCDVGTPAEQMERFEAYCNAHEPCESCPLDRPRVCPSCGVHWAQMPYKPYKKVDKQ